MPVRSPLADCRVKRRITPQPLTGFVSLRACQCLCLGGSRREVRAEHHPLHYKKILGPVGLVRYKAHIYREFLGLVRDYMDSMTGE